MIQTNITARLDCTRRELLSRLALSGIKTKDGRVWNPVKQKYSVVRGNPFVFVNKTYRQSVEVIYAGHKLDVLWFRVRPIGGETR